MVFFVRLGNLLKGGGTGINITKQCEYYLRIKKRMYELLSHKER